jgi:hypothetical protein
VTCWTSTGVEAEHLDARQHASRRSGSTAPKADL